MRNHHEKARDIARSVLPSTARRGARQDRRLAHHRERARLRRELHHLSTLADPVDHEGDLTWTARRELREMVYERRAADKVGPLVTWATRTVERSKELTAASPPGREAFFRKVLPSGVIGDHAVTHLWSVIEGDSRRVPRPRPAPDMTSRDRVEALVAMGLHGELNRRIRLRSPTFEFVRVRVPAAVVVDDDHPAPGVVVPAHYEIVRRRVHVRFLLGAHDIDAFVRETHLGVGEARRLHDEMVGR